MAKETKTVHVGTSVSTLLGVAFVILKLLGKITWSWWWVLLPFYWWVPVLVILFFIGLLFNWGRG